MPLRRIHMPIEAERESPDRAYYDNYQALGLSEQINEMIRQSFEALSCINTDIKRELAHTAPLPWCKDALEKVKLLERN